MENENKFDHTLNYTPAWRKGVAVGGGLDFLIENHNPTLPIPSNPQMIGLESL
jgi:hypothetical protein